VVITTEELGGHTEMGELGNITALGCFGLGFCKFVFIRFERLKPGSQFIKLCKIVHVRP
jgi:hypothetical protein